MNPKLIALLKEVQLVHNAIQALHPTLYDTQATTLQTTVMQLLGQHTKLTVPDIARLHQSSRQNIQVVINELITLGIVTTLSNPKHKTSKLYTLTTVGQEIYKRNQQAFHNFISSLDIEGDYDAALALLQKLSTALHP